MNFDIEYLGRPDSGVFADALKEEGFFEDYMEGSPMLFGMEQMLDWFRLKDETGDFAYMAQLTGPQPNTATVWIFLQRKGTAKDLKPEFREFGVTLWDLWFKQMKLERVQAYVPLSKLKHVKLLSSWRFQEETRMNGIRNGAKIDGKWQDLSIMGLVIQDLPNWWRNSLIKGE